MPKSQLNSATERNLSPFADHILQITSDQHVYKVCFLAPPLGRIGMLIQRSDDWRENWWKLSAKYLKDNFSHTLNNNISLFVHGQFQDTHNLVNYSWRVWSDKRWIEHNWSGWGSYATMYRAYIHYDPDSKIHGANMGPTWVLSAPDGLHVGPMKLAIREIPSQIYNGDPYTNTTLSS